MQNGRIALEKSLVMSFNCNEPVTIGTLSVTAFPKFHDACDPYSFTVSCDNVRVGIFTDIGKPCDHLIRHFKQCHAAFLEANYDEAMLANGNYPYHLKARIRGGNGHLSNKQALELFKACQPAFMSHLFLSHLSKNNNCPLLVQALFDAHANGVKMIVASRYEETPVYHITTSSTGVTGIRKRPVLSSQLAFTFS